VTRRTFRKRTRGGLAFWRDALRSWWIALTFIPFGWLGWAAFLYAGLRARRPPWTAFSALYFVAAATSIALLSMEPEGPGDPDTWREATGAWIGIATWAATFVHALVIRRPYLERMDVGEDPQLDAAEDRLRRRERALELARDNPEHARELGIGRPDLPGAYHGEVVDVNNASVEAIARLPGFTKRLARRTVEIREEIDGFESIYDLADFVDLSPSAIELLENRVVFLPR
jgi:hypothetical protein